MILANNIAVAPIILTRGGRHRGRRFFCVIATRVDLAQIKSNAGLLFAVASIRRTFNEWSLLARC
jgi:hypothetical protein